MEWIKITSEEYFTITELNREYRNQIADMHHRIEYAVTMLSLSDDSAAIQAREYLLSEDDIEAVDN